MNSDTQEKPIVNFEKKEKFGIERIYPADTTAELFCRLARKKTLFRDELGTIGRLGFRVVLSGGETEYF